MCSLKLPEPLFGIEAGEAVYAAVADVAERSFFCLIDPCEPDRFAGLAALHDRWLIASVHFDDGLCSGSVACQLPEALAIRLLDAFSGRDPGDPPPENDEVLDLVGEFANMICGAWLTRAVNQRTFTLSPPLVTPVPEAPAASGPDAAPDLFVVIEELPCAVNVSFNAASATLATA
jgi:hypothetical protein